jgi:hypothetical protein
MKILVVVLVAAVIAVAVGPQTMSAVELKSVIGACECNGTSGPFGCPKGEGGDENDCAGGYYVCNPKRNGWGDCTSFQTACGVEWTIEDGFICIGGENKACTPD